MTMALRIARFALNNLRVVSHIRMMSGDELGRGAGKGGGGGGSVREAGGAFGKMEAAREEEYFRRKQAEQLEALKKHINEEIEFHKKEIQEHKDGLARHEEKLKELEDLHEKE